MTIQERVEAEGSEPSSTWMTPLLAITSVGLIQAPASTTFAMPAATFFYSHATALPLRMKPSNLMQFN
jgi:hypothetical protein